jgi:hypothetical protein
MLKDSIRDETEEAIPSISAKLPKTKAIESLLDKTCIVILLIARHSPCSQIA